MYYNDVFQMSNWLALHKKAISEPTFSLFISVIFSTVLSSKWFSYMYAIPYAGFFTYVILFNPNDPTDYKHYYYF